MLEHERATSLPRPARRGDSERASIAAAAPGRRGRGSCRGRLGSRSIRPVREGRRGRHTRNRHFRGLRPIADGHVGGEPSLCAAPSRAGTRARLAARIAGASRRSIAAPTSSTPTDASSRRVRGMSSSRRRVAPRDRALPEPASVQDGRARRPEEERDHAATPREKGRERDADLARPPPLRRAEITTRGNDGEQRPGEERHDHGSAEPGSEERGELDIAHAEPGRVHERSEEDRTRPRRATPRPTRPTGRETVCTTSATTSAGTMIRFGTIRRSRSVTVTATRTPHRVRRRSPRPRSRRPRSRPIDERCEDETGGDGRMRGRHEALVPPPRAREILPDDRSLLRGMARPPIGCGTRTPASPTVSGLRTPGHGHVPAERKTSGVTRLRTAERDDTRGLRHAIAARRWPRRSAVLAGAGAVLRVERRRSSTIVLARRDGGGGLRSPSAAGRRAARPSRSPSGTRSPGSRTGRSSTTASSKRSSAPAAPPTRSR